MMRGQSMTNLCISLMILVIKLLDEAIILWRRMLHRKCSDTVHLPAEGVGDIYVQVAVKPRALIPIWESPFPRDLLSGAVKYRAFVNISVHSIFSNIYKSNWEPLANMPAIKSTRNQSIWRILLLQYEQEVLDVWLRVPYDHPSQLLNKGKRVINQLLWTTIFRQKLAEKMLELCHSLFLSACSEQSWVEQPNWGKK